MVDSGAKRSAIRADLIANRNSFPIRNTNTCWRTADGGIARNVLGETSLTIRYKGHVVELPKVIVMTNRAAPFILGIEWIDAMRAAVTTKDGRGVVTLKEGFEQKQKHDETREKPVHREQKMEEKLNPRQSEGKVEIEGPAREWTKLRIKVQSRSRYRRTLAYIRYILDLSLEYVAQEKSNIRQSWMTQEDYAARRSGIRELEPIIENPLHEEYVSANEDANKQWMSTYIANIIEEDSKRRIKVPPRTMLKPEKGQSVQARHRKFFSFRTPGAARDGQWMISSASGEKNGSQWASPSCLVMAKDGVVQVPITNGGKSLLRWNSLRSSIEAVPWHGEIYDGEASSSEMIASIEPEWYNNPEDVFEPNVDPGLTSEQQIQVLDTLERHRRLFRKKKGLTHLVEHQINTDGAKPVNCTPSRTSFTQRTQIRKLVQQMNDEDIVEPANSPWCSRVVLAPKPNGGVRFCVDYRAVNKVTIKDTYPLPVMDDLIGHLDGATYFSSVDLESGFWQIAVAKEDRPKTAFITPDGVWQFKRLPFGLQSSPPNFQRLMDQVLGDLRWLECLCYLDDILIFGKTFEQHLERLERVLQAIGDAGLTLNPKKCVFGTRCVKFLGHLIDAEGVHPNPEKVNAIKEFPRPDDVSKLRGFLGMTSFFRKFIRGFAKIARPLHELLKKGKDVRKDWTEEHDQAMEALKYSLITAPVLTHDDGVSAIELQTDASLSGLGGVLLLHRDGTSKPITFISRRLTPAETKYHANELEFLALLWSLNKLRHHVNGRTCVVKTDSSVVKWVCERRDMTKNHRLTRWVADLMGFDVVIQHLKGVANVVADTLSRNPVGGEPNPEENYLAALNRGNEEFLSALGKAYDEYFCALAAGYEPRDLAILQYGDPEIRKIILGFQNLAEVPEAVMNRYDIRQGVLYLKNEKGGKSHMLVVPSIIRKELLEECHDTPTSGHHGVEKTLARLKKSYYWNNMEASVRAYVRSCAFCQPYKSRIGHKAGKLCPIPPPRQVNEQYGIDHLGPFKKTRRGNRHIIVAIDYLSRWVEAKAVPDTSSKFVTKFIEKRILYKHGWFFRLISDQGSAFSSREFAEFCGNVRLKHIMCSAEHPESNGLVERVNRAIASTLAAFVNLKHDDWDVKLHQAVFAINSAKQSTTQKSPFELVYGRPAVTPDEVLFPWVPQMIEGEDDFMRKVARWRKVARSLILAQQRKSKTLADRFRNPDPVFKLGDLVLVARRRVCVGKTKKFVCRSIGPYQVVRRVNRVCYTVEDLPQNRRTRIHRRFNAHVSLLRRYNPRIEMDWRPEDGTEQSTDNDGTPEDNSPVDEPEIPRRPLLDFQPVDYSNHRGTRSETDASESKEYDDTVSDYEEENQNIPESRDLGVSRYGRVRVARRDPDFVYQPP